MNADKPDAISPDGNFANFMMVIVAAPVVMAWVGLSIFLVAMAFREPSIVQDIESYKSVLLIIGSPALVIIYKVLELWTAQQNSQIEQFNKQLTFNRDQFNTQNSNLVEQSNVTWRRQLNTANTAGTNAVNQANAMNSFNLSNQGLSFLWQEMRDAAKWEYESAQNAEERQTNLSIAALGNEAATDATKSENISALAGFGLKVWEKFDSNRNK